VALFFLATRFPDLFPSFWIESLALSFGGVMA
jgi:hypothetical protein